MMLSASYLGAGSDEYFDDRWDDRWFAQKGRRTSRRGGFLDAAFMLPSIVAELAPLVLFWNAHLPVWQISAMMGGAWTLMWWLTWLIAAPLPEHRG